ncbi:hypothetical protein PFISCL1PPCAC_2615, partial [Pristionchus fissidentatus]
SCPKRLQEPFQKMDSLPLEVWQNILTFCDENSMETVEKHFPNLIDKGDPTWKRLCMRDKEGSSIPDVVFSSEFLKQADFPKILHRKPFMRNLIQYADMYTQNIMTSPNDYAAFSYRCHDRRSVGVVTIRFPLENLGLSGDLLTGRFRFSFDQWTDGADVLVKVEIKTLVHYIDDGVFYGDEDIEVVDEQISRHRIGECIPFRAVTIDYSSPSHSLQSVANQEVLIRLEIPKPITVSNFRLYWNSTLGENDIMRTTRCSRRLDSCNI